MLDVAALPELLLPDVMVPMRDGVRLATDIYLPDGPGPFPVLLERTPYGKTCKNRADRTAADPSIRSKPDIARFFADAGYAVVIQDCRGRYGSEGEFTKYLSEGEDGEDALAWVLLQGWCDGRVGTFGLSYGAHVQAALACGNPPGLGAMFLDSGGFSSAYHGGIRQGGAYELKQLTWAYKHALIACEARHDQSTKDALERQDMRWWMAQRWRKGWSPLAAIPEYEDYVLEQWDRDKFSPFWQKRGIYAAGWYERFADVPQVHMSSWYDPYSQTAIDNFLSLSQLKQSPVRLVLGPWTHGQRSVSHSGDVDFGPAATLDGNLADDYFALRRDWFDHHLRGLAIPDPLPDPVTIFLMGGGSGRRNAQGRLDHGGRWLRGANWPLAGLKVEPLWLHADGAMLPVPVGDENAQCSFQSDPANPVPTIGGAITSGEPFMHAGAFDQRESEDLLPSVIPGRALAEREDVLVFRTPPLEADTALIGNVRAELFVSCDAPDADIAIKLIDEYPPNDDYPSGYAMNLAHGILRLRFRNSFEHAEAMIPGTVYAVSLETFPTANLFKAGHRIRIDVAGSNFPHFDVNPNTDWTDPVATPRIATVTLHCSPDHASRILLPAKPLD